MREYAVIASLVLSPVAFGFTTIWQQEFFGTAVNSGSGNTLRARALFHHYTEGSNSFLRIELTNAMTGVAPGKTIVNSDLLSSLFWRMEGTLTPVSASLGPESNFFFASDVTGRDIGGEWAYRPAINNYRPGINVHGVSAVGLDLFGAEHRFNGNNLHGQLAPAGRDFSLLPRFATQSLLNPNMTNSPRPLVQDSAVFVFQTGNPLAMPGQVWAQYGTDLNLPSILLTPTSVPPQGEPIPEPFTMALGAGALALAAARRRKKR